MTQLPKTSAALVSDADDFEHEGPEPLVAPAFVVFDQAAAQEDLTRILDDCADAKAIRAATVDYLKDANAKGRAVIKEAFLAEPTHARPTTSAYAFLTDGLVRTVHWVAETYLHRNSNPTKGERLAVIAVGGYGRAEMAPHSDVDLLFLTPTKITAWAESTIESMLYMLWDLRLKVGQASRTIADCIRLGREDFTIRTSLVEQRYICGDQTLGDELRDQLWTDLFQSTASEFIEAKLEERAERHRKQGGQRYMVEPNVKEGKGGLRDLQSLFWMNKYLHGVDDPGNLVELGVFTDDEFETFLRAEDFLWATRCHLHLVASRPVDQLTFDMQVEVADAMGYTDHSGRRGVEHFMQAYFRHATSVGELTRIFLTALENDHLKSEPMLMRIFKRKPRVRAPFAIEQNRITVPDPEVFVETPVNMLRIFEEALRTGTLIHPNAMRILAANIPLVDNNLRSTPEAKRIFLDLLLKHDNPERSLRRMNELGVLSAFIPEFEPIVAMMQFNMYHSYTVDEHTIQTISHLHRIEKGELLEDLPVASDIIQSGINRKVLYVALLLHDIGKGRPEDHSILGAQIARKVCPRLGLSKSECETVEWLVRYHLLMSDTAQKRDIADPRTVRDFAKAVKSVGRLDLLLLVTVCDIRGVGPDTWNNWKASLLRALYRQTRRALEGGMEALNRETRGAEAKKALRAALPDWGTKELRVETNRHYPPYWQGLHVTAHVDVAHLLRGIGDVDIRVKLTMDEDRDATRAVCVMADHPGIFSRIAGALALVGANIVDARTFTTKDGYATAAFWVQDANETPFEASRLPRLEQMIGKTLRGEVITRDALAPKDKIKKREKAFRVPTTITFDNDGSDIYTIIEVDTRDRPGLLHDLTRALAAANINIGSAIIATYGEQVVDAFYVKDMFGLKFYSESKQKSLERNLRDAIERGVERAAEA